MRARARERAAERRASEDRAYLGAYVARLADLYPKCPAAERAAIADHACTIGSGRVGRTAASKQLDPAALEAAVRAHVRHRWTTYDELLASGTDRGTARTLVRDDVECTLAGWRSGPRTDHEHALGG